MQHKNCIHFENGYCKLHNTPVNPEGIACINFMPKQVSTQQIKPPIHYSLWPPQYQPPQYSILPPRRFRGWGGGGGGFLHRLMHRFRHRFRHRHRRGWK